jgi:transcriptional regulator with XRE-family HTH domain
MENIPLRDSMLDFSFATADEIAQELAGRLRAARLAQGLQQSELALRAGVSAGTVKALEKSGQSTVTSLIRVVQALGLTQDLQQAFVLEVRSIAQMEQAQRAQRQRAPRRPKPKDTDVAPANTKA